MVFDELGVEKLQKMKESSVEYTEVLETKKQAYAEYREVKNGMKKLLIAQWDIDFLHNVEEGKQEKQTH